MQKKLIYTSIIFFILLMIGYFFVMNNWRIRDAILEYKHDRTYRNKAVTTKAQIDKVYAKFEQIHRRAVSRGGFVYLVYLVYEVYLVYLVYEVYIILISLC